MKPVKFEHKQQRANVVSLSDTELKRVHGARSVAVTVDGTHSGTVDDFAINMAIFEGRIGGPYLL
jgi:hypothetical protein